MIFKILTQRNRAFNKCSKTASIAKPKQINETKFTAKKTPEIVPTKKESIFPQPPREMVWKQINGRLVAEWISIDPDRK